MGLFYENKIVPASYNKTRFLENPRFTGMRKTNPSWFTLPHLRFWSSDCLLMIFIRMKLSNYADIQACLQLAVTL